MERPWKVSWLGLPIRAEPQCPASLRVACAHTAGSREQTLVPGSCPSWTRPLHRGPDSLPSEEVPAGQVMSDTQTGLHERTQDGSSRAPQNNSAPLKCKRGRGAEETERSRAVPPIRFWNKVLDRFRVAACQALRDDHMAQP